MSATSSVVRRLSRATHDGRPTAPVRVLHMGLGNFFRAHQAWYTDRAPDSAEWGIAAFTGRRPHAAQALGAQDGLYSLITRGPDGDRFDVPAALSAVHPGGDHAAWLGYWRQEALAVVTLTVTEAGYTRGADGSLAVDRDDVRADIHALSEDPDAPVRTAVGKLVAGLEARRAAGLGPVALVPCDNLPGNGAVLERLVRELAERTGRPEPVEAADKGAAYVTTMVDRITPATSDEHRAAVLAHTGLVDSSPVVTEPFSEWVISGEFPAGRPRWEDSGATFTDDVTPYEERKLWLLNGAHSLLAYAATLRGHETVAEAVADPVCHEWLEEWWNAACLHLTLPQEELDAYRAALLERFGNPRIRHALAQIAADGSQKLPVRILPALRRERARGALPLGATRVLAAWVCHLRGLGAPVQDAAGAALPRIDGSLPDAVRAVLGHLDPALAADVPVVEAVLAQAAELSGEELTAS
ncbi:mannitol dehydrogenase family protein [Streptomyces cavernicola]|uniref:Mannitol dehydrogenase family protein n=1 Tax=Streptomyces cavernicola TaxID=3043613 RepID=A0ABT6S659_9ACTN|nr:mannitol dehydrogenase family protein [Streptomyces sp. B-S-A6]MDI3403404.1 mannitol dehydrogenase family protein [Streptomyces sp. B-S-A6]